MKKFPVVCIAFAVIAVAMALSLANDVVQYFRDNTPRGELARAAHAYQHIVWQDEVEVPWASVPERARKDAMALIVEHGKMDKDVQVSGAHVCFSDDGKRVTSLSVRLWGHNDSWGFPFPRMDEAETKAFVEKAIADMKSGSRK